MGADRTGEALYSILEGNEDCEVVVFWMMMLKREENVISSSAVVGDTGLLPSLVKDKSIEKLIVSKRHELLMLL
jgi:hypothetical protein